MSGTKLTRPFELTTAVGAEIPGEWRAIDPTRTIGRAIAVNYEFAEETIAMLYYTDHTVEVGVGESLRPYERLYKGSNYNKASEEFVRAIMQRSFALKG
jgi:hypothetical protein